MRARTPSYRADVDGLRAIAVSAVVLYHAFPTLLPGGFVGVDVFFVISGFLISSILFRDASTNELDLAAFYGRRVRRIFPALLVVLSVTYVASWFVLLPEELKRLGRHIASAAGFVVNLALTHEAGYFDAQAGTKPLLHLWSLGVEEQYYIVWPAILLLAWKRCRIPIVLATLGALSFALNVATVEHHATFAFYSPVTRFWELLMGASLAWVDRRRDSSAEPPRTRALGSFAGLLLVLLACISLDDRHPFPGWRALPPTVGATLIIAAGPRAPLNRLVLSNPLLVWLGLISYPLYLWHWPLLSLAEVTSSDTIAPSPGLRCLAVTTSIILASLTHRLVEAPLRFGEHRRAKAYALVVAMAVVGSVGVYTSARSGFPSRFPALVAELVTSKYDYERPYRAGACFLLPGTDPGEATKCEPATAPVPRRSIVLWGDSHAAHLYPGYQAVFGATHSIVQRTAWSCPPFLGVEIPGQPDCVGINDRVYRLVLHEKPERVVLAAYWVNYDWRKVGDTVATLRASGIDTIDVVGPVPLWNGGLPRQLSRYFARDLLHRIPDRMTFGLNDEANALESSFAPFARSLPVRYLSPREILCDSRGCLTRVGEGLNGLVAWDKGHLTEEGSKYLVGHFPRD